MCNVVCAKEEQDFMDNSNLINILKIVFPALMVTGATGSLIVNLIANRQDWPVSLQWLGAALLYTALLFRNK